MPRRPNPPRRAVRPASPSIGRSGGCQPTRAAPTQECVGAMLSAAGANAWSSPRLRITGTAGAHAPTGHAASRQEHRRRRATSVCGLGAGLGHSSDAEHPHRCSGGGFKVRHCNDPVNPSSDSRPFLLGGRPSPQTQPPHRNPRPSKPAVHRPEALRQASCGLAQMTRFAQPAFLSSTVSSDEAVLHQVTGCSAANEGCDEGCQVLDHGRLASQRVWLRGAWSRGRQ